MFELLLFPLALLYLLSLALLLSRLRPPTLRVKPAARATGAAPLRAQPLRLRIEGTERPALRTTKFVSAFGIDVRALRDIRVYERGGDLESFPPRLVQLLHFLHRHGCVNGTEAVALLFHGRALNEGEALYFALVDLPPEPRVVAFIDRWRG
jgi:hypothetical protein